MNSITLGECAQVLSRVLGFQSNCVLRRYDVCVCVQMLFFLKLTVLGGNNYYTAYTMFLCQYRIYGTLSSFCCSLYIGLLCQLPPSRHSRTNHHRAGDCLPRTLSLSVQDCGIMSYLPPQGQSHLHLILYHCSLQECLGAPPLLSIQLCLPYLLFRACLVE